MYNMDISIGSYKVRIEIVLAIVVVFWVMFGHLLCSCCRVSLLEGATTMSRTAKQALKKAKEETLKRTEAEIEKNKKNAEKLKREIVDLS